MDRVLGEAVVRASGPCRRRTTRPVRHPPSARDEVAHVEMHASARTDCADAAPATRPSPPRTRPASSGRCARRRRRQPFARDVRKQDAAALQHAAVLDQSRDARRPPPFARRDPSPQTTGDDACLQARDDTFAQLSVSIPKLPAAARRIGPRRLAASVGRRAPARGSRCRCGIACRQSRCRAIAAYAALRLLAPNPPSAVTHSTRPPLTTVADRPRAPCPHGNTTTSGWLLR